MMRRLAEEAIDWITPSPPLAQRKVPKIIIRRDRGVLKVVRKDELEKMKVDRKKDVKKKAPKGFTLGMGLQVLNDNEFIDGIYGVLKGMIAENGKVEDAPDDRRRSSFMCKQYVDLHQYIRRLVSHMACSRSIFIAALIYLERLGEHIGGLKVSAKTVHRLFTMACMIGIKYYEDDLYPNTYYQKVGGIGSLEDFNRMEWMFLTGCEWKLRVEAKDFTKCEVKVFENGTVFSDWDSDD